MNQDKIVSLMRMKKHKAAENKSKFYNVLVETLTESVAKNPERYAYGVEAVPEIAFNMTEALKHGFCDITESVRKTAKILGIKPTAQSINDYLTGDVLL